MSEISKVNLDGVEYSVKDETARENAGNGTEEISGDYIPVPATAKVGQIVQVSAVDASGKPTAWVAVDMPSGSGGASDFSELFRVETTEEVTTIETGINLNNYSEIVALCQSVSSDGTTTTHFDFNPSAGSIRLTSGLHATQKRVFALIGHKVVSGRWAFQVAYCFYDGTLFKNSTNPINLTSSPAFAVTNGTMNSNFTMGAFAFGGTKLAIGTQAIVYGR